MIYQTFISKELRLVKFLIEIWCVSEFLYSNFINLLNLWKAWWIFWNIPLHSFSEELALLTSAAIYNLIWGSFTFLASKVGRPPKIHQKKENLRCQSYSHLELCSTASIWSTSSTRWPFFKLFKILSSNHRTFSWGSFFLYMFSSEEKGWLWWTISRPLYNIVHLCLC